ncbi:Flp family type IVb pilin [Roseinatronobacter sp. S2]|uniref:Flp family type IVb pilin n=1 Tax=Roseinatronobacter sp. S2 TaxID=3035471 RepID=UPI00240EAC64|nr:Flp family type IVb pilin [Roseinatronobacter sp. S2]WFE77032.1 Flp family type IVb pilin [Roseinatronobacter sp. S2]
MTKYMTQRFKNFLKKEDGATAIEYGLFAALVSAVIVAAVATLGGSVNTAFETVNDELECAASADPTDC